MFSASIPVYVLAGNAVQIHISDTISADYTYVVKNSGGTEVFAGSGTGVSFSIPITEVVKSLIAAPDPVALANINTSFATISNFVASFTVEVSNGTNIVTLSSQVVYGGIRKDLFRALAKKSTDIFAEKLLNSSGNFLMTTRTKSPEISVKETELFPFLFLPCFDNIEVRSGNVILDTIAGQAPSPTDCFAVNIDVIRKHYFALHNQLINRLSFCKSSTIVINVGDTFQGGTIAYILQPGDIGYDANKIKGIIAASSDITPSRWSNVTNTLIGLSAQSLTDGSGNTTAIINQSGFISGAASACRALSTGGFADWYLPSSSELEKLYNAGILTGTTQYWSSTEDASTPYSVWGSYCALALNFLSGSINYAHVGKNSIFHVRAIRQFSVDKNTVNTLFSINIVESKNFDARALLFRNSYGAYEKIELNGVVKYTPEISADSDYLKYDTITDSFTSERDRPEGTEKYTAEIGYDTPARRLWCRDVLGSDDCYYIENGTWNRALITAESSVLEESKPTATSLSIVITLIDKELNYTPVDDDPVVELAGAYPLPYIPTVTLPVVTGNSVTELLTGVVNGVNKIFTTSRPFVPGTEIVYLNGNHESHYTLLNSTTVQYDSAPKSKGYLDVVSITYTSA